MLIDNLLLHFQVQHDRKSHMNVLLPDHNELEATELSIQNVDKHRRYQMLDQHLNCKSKKHYFILFFCPYLHCNAHRLDGLCLVTIEVLMPIEVTSVPCLSTTYQ